VLKELGFSLEQIAGLMHDPPDAAELRRMLLLRRNDVERSLATEAQRLRHIETRIAQLEADGAMSADDVIERPEPARRLLSLRRIVPSFAQARELIGVLHEHARGVLPRGHRCPMIAVAHGLQFEADAIDVEFGYDVQELDIAAPAPGSPLSLRDLPAVPRLVACVRVGPPEDAHRVTEKIGRFIAANGDRIDGPGREVFLRPVDPQRLQEAVVEMQFPVCRAASP
jgi:DNA-binding transcriptional MerR regulator